MWPSSTTLYTQLRAVAAKPDAFHEGQDPPPEQLLQAIWQYQRLHRHKLRTLNGNPVFILHPGFLNLESGPDFRNAVIQVGGQAPQTGDVEVDPCPADWIHHKHEGNPEYRNVVLHVVWRSTNSGPSPANTPLLELAPFLDAPLAELSEWLVRPSTKLPPGSRGKCAAPLRDLRPDQVERLLSQAALFRLQTRSTKVEARAREAGWTQSLWEGLFRALGYKHNAWPMLYLGELRQCWETPDASRTVLLARLLGLSGLLPPDTGRRHTASSNYIRKLWDSWWRDRDQLGDKILPPKTWRLAGIRPANHPNRRLALAAAWVSQGDVPDRLQQWCRTPCTDAQLPASLVSILKPSCDPYWSKHYTLRSRTCETPIPLLGTDRATDLAANVILPWLWARAKHGRRTPLCEEVERRYLAWPGGADNAALKLARQRLFGGRKAPLPWRMSTQQGLLQIARDYCDRSDSMCVGCQFPNVASRFGEL